MSNLILTNEDIVQNIATVVELLVDAGKSFTAYNVTQIVRTSGVFVKHNTVREYFQEFEIPEGYNHQLILVGEQAHEAVLYTNFSLKLDPKTVIYSELSDFEDIVDKYLEWFEGAYHFELPGTKAEDSEESVEEAVEEAPGDDLEAIVSINIPGAGVIDIPMSKRELANLISNGASFLAKDVCKRKMEQ